MAFFSCAMSGMRVPRCTLARPPAPPAGFPCSPPTGRRRVARFAVPSVLPDDGAPSRCWASCLCPTATDGEPACCRAFARLPLCSPRTGSRRFVRRLRASLSARRRRGAVTLLGFCPLGAGRRPGAVALLSFLPPPPPPPTECRCVACFAASSPPAADGEPSQSSACAPLFRSYALTRRRRVARLSASSSPAAGGQPSLHVCVRWCRADGHVRVLHVH